MRLEIVLDMESAACDNATLNECAAQLRVAADAIENGTCPIPNMPYKLGDHTIKVCGYWAIMWGRDGDPNPPGPAWETAYNAWEEDKLRLIEEVVSRFPEGRTHD